MCGVFGFVAKGDRAVDLTQLKRIARVTMRRGDHAFGFAWVDSRGRLKMFKSAGKIVDHLGLLDMARDARMLIGHCRYTTAGAEKYNINNHPHPVDGGWLVHNGMLPGWRSVRTERGWQTNSECDTELLGLAYEDADGSPVERAAKAAELAEGWPLVTLSLWSRPRRLLAVKQGNPLCLGQEREGTYLASLSDDLPGDVVEVADNRVLEFTGGKMEVFEILRPKPKAPRKPKRKDGPAAKPRDNSSYWPYSQAGLWPSSYDDESDSQCSSDSAF
jgi:glucosamine 6-phosphate synthetase-like amidotransferase/phosphosugar isomerase protein